MCSPAIQDFNRKFSDFAELRQNISAVQSLPEFIAVLQDWECHLTGAELVTLAQQAYQTWLDCLDPKVQPFFAEAHQNKALNQAIEDCRNPNDVVVLAKSYGFELTESDITTAAEAAYKIEGFSFEKLWFKGLGL